VDGHGVALFRGRAVAGRQFFNLQIRIAMRIFAVMCRRVNKALHRGNKKARAKPALEVLSS